MQKLLTLQCVKTFIVHHDIGMMKQMSLSVLRNMKRICAEVTASQRHTHTGDIFSLGTNRLFQCRHGNITSPPKETVGLV